MKDVEIQELIEKERQRQLRHIELIASENFASQAVLEACGSVLSNKYAEGYPRRRYYGGCEYVDAIETLAIERAKELFCAEHANVQPHSGTQANMAVYLAILKPGDKVLSMGLDAGGHLSHGHHLSFSGSIYSFYHYGVDEKNELIDYEEVERKALEIKPKLIVCGASAYSRTFDFKKFREIADAVGAYLMVDIAHYAGLVAAGLFPSPVPYADFVTSTTQKTLRGPRGGLILCKEKYKKIIDMAVFPGIQGGPLENNIAGKALCFKEAMSPSFVRYQKQVLLNCQAFMKAFEEEGIRIVSSGSDSHLFMIDLRSFTDLNGKEAEEILGQIKITTNKNSLPFDPKPPVYTSGLRFGTSAMTSRGFKEEDFYQVGKIIIQALKNYQDTNKLAILTDKVVKMVEKLPLREE